VDPGSTKVTQTSSVNTVSSVMQSCVPGSVGCNITFTLSPDDVDVIDTLYSRSPVAAAPTSLASRSSSPTEVSSRAVWATARGVVPRAELLGICPSSNTRRMSNAACNRARRLRIDEPASLYLDLRRRNCVERYPPESGNQVHANRHPARATQPAIARHRLGRALKHRFPVGHSARYSD